MSTWDPMHFPFCTHTYMHTHTLPSLKRWLSVAACSPWINMDRMYCGIVESVFPSPCQGILLGWCFLTQMFMLSSLESETFFLLFLTTFRIVNISHEVTVCGVIALGAWREFPLLQQNEKSSPSHQSVNFFNQITLNDWGWELWQANVPKVHLRNRFITSTWIIKGRISGIFDSSSDLSSLLMLLFSLFSPQRTFFWLLTLSVSIF